MAMVMNIEKTIVGTIVMAVVLTVVKAMVMTKVIIMAMISPQCPQTNLHARWIDVEENDQYAS